tara:strand:+ start:415 stop:648 length:234 start_codon:yes stop_codon:yes gene_type:complete
MAKYAYEYGKRWDKRTPRGAIEWLVNRLHVNETMESVELEIGKRFTDEFPNHIRRQSLEYARITHTNNQNLVMKFRF